MTPEEISRALEAFPAQRGMEGMTLRDYFAAAALTGLIAAGVDVDPGWLTLRAYDFANAMLIERAKPREERT